jgi:hypothetical protein
MFRCRDHLTTAEGNIFPGNGKAIDKGEQCAVLKLMLDPKCTNDNVYEEYPKPYIYVKNPKCTNDNVYEEYPKRYVEIRSYNQFQKSWDRTISFKSLGTDATKPLNFNTRQSPASCSMLCPISRRVWCVLVGATLIGVGGGGGERYCV